jgi:TPR repeat protein
MKKLYISVLIFFSFSTSVFSAPSFNSIFDSITDETIEIAENEYDEAMELSDRANLPTKEMLEKAFKLYKSAAEKGHIFAMHNLARSYQNGKFSTINYDEAFGWYLNASKFGFAGSQNNLGDMYENGKGTKQSYSDAIYWYTQAAMQGEPTAYFSLGSMYKDGLGVQKNLIESAFWLTLAKANLTDGLNLKDAIASLNEIKKDVSSEQLTEAETRARFFQPLRQTETKISDR